MIILPPNYITYILGGKMDIQDKKSLIERLYWEEKRPVSEVAQLLGCSERTFHNWRQSLGILRRPRERFRDLKGKTFGKWTVHEKINKNGKVYWTCQCECGNKCNILPCSLIGRRSTKCRSCVHNSLASNIDVPNFYWARVLVGACSRNLAVEITQEESRELFREQQGKCALSGLSIRFGKSVREFTLGLNTASLDRKDSSRGYIKGNIQWLHKVVNLMKQELSDQEFIDYCRKVSRHADASGL